LFEHSGEAVQVSPDQISVTGDLGRMLANCLADADSMYANSGDKVAGKYGYEEKRALYNWWQALKGMEKDLKHQKKFKEAKAVALVKKKAVETAYNYYTIEPQKISDKLGIVIFSLVFYVIYTLWYGFAILFLFEGWGLKLEH
jgi:predicted amidophosphoribosyltransferase